MRRFAVLGICLLWPSLAFGQAWQVPLNTIPYGKGPGQNNFGSVANTGSGTLCLLNTTPPSFGTCSGSLPTLLSGRLFVGNGSNVATSVPLSGDCTLVAAGAITCTKTGGVAFGVFATGTNASGLTGTVAAAQGGFGTSVAASTGVPIFTAGVPTFQATMGTGNIGRADGSTFTNGAFNGTLGATTPSSIRATTGTFSGQVGFGVTTPSFGFATQVKAGTSQTLLTTSDFTDGTTGSALGFYFGTATGNTYSKIQSYTTGASVAGNIALNSDGGDVGVGTASPGYRLDVVSNANSALTSRVFNNSAGASAVASLTADNGTNKAYFGVRGTGTAASGVLGPNDGEFGADQSVSVFALAGSIKFAANGATEQMRLDTTGRLGIGTTSPATQLHTTGTVRFANYTCAGGGGTLTVDGAGTLACSDAAAMRTLIGLGTAAVQNTGTSGANLPFLNGTNTWAAAQTFTTAPVFTDASGSRTALGLGTIATQNANSVAITGGALNGTLGATTPNSIKGTTGTFSGQVGFGVVTPSFGFATQVKAGTAQTLLTTSDFVDATTGSALGFYFGAATGNTYSKIQGYTAGSSLAGNIGLNSDGGNVGIGTNTPGAQLHTTGTIRFANYTCASAGGTLTVDGSGNLACSDAAAMRTLIGLGTIAVQNANSVAITGGAISGATIGAASHSTGKFTTLEATSTVKFGALTVPGCLGNDASGNISGGNACSGGGMPAGGNLGQAPLNSAAGTALWRTEPFVNISGLSGVDCTGTVATVISTAMGTNKAVALPTDCVLKVTGSDTIPFGTFLSIPCGARIQMDGATILTFSGETDDTDCQKFSASGAGAGSGGGTVRGLMLNRPEWWGAVGDCNYGGACTHDDYGPIQQAFNSVQNANSSSAGVRAQVKFSCNKGYGVSTGIVATASRSSPLLIDGCAPLDGGNSEGGSAIYGRSGFTGIILTVTVSGTVTTSIEIRELKISSINNFQADTCLQVGSAGNTISNGSGHSIAHNLQLTNCKHLLKFGGSVISFQFDRIWMAMGNNGGASGANSSCIEAVPNAEVLSELTFTSIACDGAPNSDASAICLNFHSQGASGGITGTRINDVSCYQPTKGIVINADGASLIADFWCYSCQMDSLRTNSTGYYLATTGTAHIVDVVLDKAYSTNLGAPFDLLNIDGSGGGTIDYIGVYGFYAATGGASRAIRVETASKINIEGARIGGSYVSQGILLNNCTGCLANNNIFSGSVPQFVLMGSSTDYSQACNNTASGALAPAAVSASGAAGTHNVFFASGYQSCPNN